MKDSFKSGFEAAERQHLASFSKLSPTQKLDWLQQAKDFCRKYLGAAKPKARPDLAAPKTP